MLGDTTSLTGNHIGIADMVEQTGLTMVNMSHHGNDRCTSYQVVLIIFLLGNSVLYLCTDIFGLKAELISHDINSLSIQTLVDTYHDTDTHTGTDNLIDTDIHHRSQLTNSNELGQLQNIALSPFLSSLLTQMLLNGITFFTTILGAFLILVLASKTGKRLFYLTCYILFINLQRFLDALLLVLLSSGSGILIIVIIVLVAFSAVVHRLTGSSIDIYTLLRDTSTFLLFVITVALLHRFLLALSAFLLL